MERSPSAHSPDVRDSRPSFRKPANEASRRNYRRHSPSSSRSRSPSSGGWKRDRSPSYQEDGVSKKGRNNGADSGKAAREDARFRRATDTARIYGNHSRDRHGRAEAYDNNFSRRHTNHYDRNYQNSRADHLRYDDGRYARRSPERPTRERNADDTGYRKREDRDRDERLSDARAADRDRVREEEADVRDRYKSKDREARRGQDRYGEKYRDEGSDVEAQQSRHGKRIDNGSGRKDAVVLEGRDRDIDKVDGRDGLKPKADIEKAKERESGRRGREDGKELESDKGDGDADGRRNRDKGHKGHDEHRRRTLPSSDNKGYSSDEPEGAGELSRERSQGQNHSRKGDKDKKYSGEKGRSKFSSLEPARGAQEAGTISDHLDETKKLDDSIKGSKWGPEADNPDPTAASSDPEVAKMAAMKAAALVNINLGGFKSVDEKKKMLWGSKDQKPAAVTSGTNRWDTVQFADRDRQEKFNKLMSLSVLSYLYPNVGCQRRCGRGWTGEHNQFVYYRKARRATARFGEAVHCGSSEARWSDCWIGSVIGNLGCTSLVFVLEMWIEISRVRFLAKHRFMSVYSICCCKVRRYYEVSLYKLSLHIYVLSCFFSWHTTLVYQSNMKLLSNADALAHV